ncbi:MAG: chorismate mutase [Clostridia bacterium]|nr:chorismate mutase [Clostridia bacterium]
MDLKECREKIDEINNEMLRLFCERMKVSRSVAEYKAANGLPILNKARERDIIYEMTEKADEGMENYVKTFYNVIMDLSRAYQGKLMNRESGIAEQIEKYRQNAVGDFPARATVACQGVEGAYSQIACEKLFNTVKIRYYRSFREVFEAVRDGECEFGLLPIENSTHGTVSEVYDLMSSFSFSVTKSIKLRVDHCLLAKSGTALADIRRVVSHSQAIGQCSNFLQEHEEIIAEVRANTAVAAKEVADSADRDIAAIASPACAELYGLERIADGIQNNPHNYTRFICISREGRIYPGANKISLMLTLPHVPGSLYTVLAKFNAVGLNLTKLESRPIEGSDFEACFYFDFEGSPFDPAVIALLEELNASCDRFVFLGGYTEK